MKKTKKFLFTISTLGAIATPIVTVVACGSSADVYDPKSKDSAMLIVGSSGHNDKGFLQGSYDGAQAALKSNAKFKKYGEIKIPTSSIPDAKQGTQNALKAGAYAIVGAGFQYPQFFNGKDFAVKYKDRMFLGLDGTVDGDYQPNMTTIDFATKGASFLAGIETGIYLNVHYTDYSSDGLNVGAFGGSKYTAITNMISGYMDGLKYFNNHLAIDNDHKIKFIGWDGDGGFTGGFTPSAKSTASANALLSKKADIIYPVAGGQVNSVVDAIKSNNSYSNVKIVGVDSDQREVFGEDGKSFITSVLKNTSTATQKGLDAIFGAANTGIKIGSNNHKGLDGGFTGISNSEPTFNVKTTSEISKLFDGSLIIDGNTIYEQLMDGEFLKQAKLLDSATTDSWQTTNSDIFKGKTTII